MDIKRLGELGPLAPAGGVNSPLAPATGEVEKGGFDNFFFNQLSEVNDDILKSQKVSEEYLVDGKHDLHEVMISLEKADISFKFLNQVRNKVLDAYNEVMRLQV